MTTPTLPPSPTPVAPSKLAASASKFPGVALAAMLSVGLLSCAWLLVNGKVELIPANLTADEVLHGTLTHKVAKQLSKSWLPEQAANLERGVSWLLFHDAGPRVRQGCDGWLFLTDEFRINPHAQANALVKMQTLSDIQQRVKQRGIKLLVVVVPDKSRMASDYLCDLRRPAILIRRVQDWTSQLSQAGVSVLDLAPSLQPLGAAAYLRTDTHWSEAGANAAANAIAAQVRTLGISATPKKNFEVKSDALTLRPGDLVRLAGIDWLPLRLQPATESVAATKISERQENVQTGGDNLDDLFADSNLPNVALIGTSFSRNSNFLGFLQLALGASVGSFAKDGGEFSGSANQYFNNPAFKQTPPKLIIWEIPERDLQTPYEKIEGI
ncbi:cell division protein FtsQ [Pseudomonas sp. Pseusp122]|uniref:alginate O-acetyltransferase AlgX-related protein n=1 Tax=unclassified Pseudomonas TaxID=196821 RepID=UPI0039A49F96